MVLFHPKFILKRDDLHVDFDILRVSFPILDGDIHCRTSYGVHIAQLRFARVCINGWVIIFFATMRNPVNEAKKGEYFGLYHCVLTKLNDQYVKIY